MTLTSEEREVAKDLVVAISSCGIRTLSKVWQRSMTLTRSDSEDDVGWGAQCQQAADDHRGTLETQ